MSADVAEAILSGDWKEPSTRSALKWGLVIVALGTGLLLVDVFGIDFESPLAYAVLLLATGTALLGYYVIERDAPDELGESPLTAPSTTQKRSAPEEAEEVTDPEL